MTDNNDMIPVHPAYTSLRDAALGERRDLARALAIETDWRYHDGPEWAAQYWQAFGDLASARAEPQAERRWQAIKARRAWPALDTHAAGQLRRVFRALLVALHPEVVVPAAHDAQATLWPRVLRAYRGGHAPALMACLREYRAMERSTRLPEHVVFLRREYERLRTAREAADRRLAALSQQFPFCLRDKLRDDDWIERQRRAWRQALVLAAPPANRHKQVS